MKGQHALEQIPNSQLKIKDQYKNKDANLDIEQLKDDIDIHLDDNSDINIIKALIAELEARVIEK